MSTDPDDDLVRGLFDHGRAVEAKRERQAALAAALAAARLPDEDADDPDLLDEIATLVAEKLGVERPADDVAPASFFDNVAGRQLFGRSSNMRTVPTVR